MFEQDDNRSISNSPDASPLKVISRHTTEIYCDDRTAFLADNVILSAATSEV